jgi:hypothetical membrane protein
MLAGACGILTVIVAMVCISLAISLSPEFSLAQNWVSDLTGLGYSNFENVPRPVVNSPVTEILTRSGFIIGGILAIVFSTGFYIDLYTDNEMLSYRLGAVFGVLGAGALSAVGIFPEPIAVPHIVASYAFFLLAPIAILLIGGALIDASRRWLGGFSIVLGVIALASTSMVSYGRGIAEMLFTFAAFVWLAVFSVRMLWRASHQMSE